ncbi:MAG: riboflavin synthase [Akkermansiaceae bacterium]|nr:riboflavin synthase [Akkermansiaceae bacterium]
MFTGLVECTGRVRACTGIQGGARYAIETPFAAELELGDSVAVNGCCLTVDALEEGCACFDLLAQTLRVTSLGLLEPGSLCNLERAVRVGDRLGGHMVSGHVDTTGEVESVRAEGQDHLVRVRVPESPGLRYVIDKGSIALDGVSLTIARIDREARVLEFWITPHTWRRTLMPAYTPGMRVNLEWDMLAKYAENFFVTQA